MRTIGMLAAIGIVAASITSGAAQPTVVEATSIANLKTCCTSATIMNANVDGYANAGDGGGGQFVVGAACAAGDDGVIVKETAGNFRCWYRQFSGPVHLSWYGVKDAADPNRSPQCFDTQAHFAACDASAIVSSVFIAAAQSAHLGGDGGVVTDGRTIVIDSAPPNSPNPTWGMDVPSNGYFSCSLPPGGERPQITAGTGAIPYYTLPGSIVLGGANFTIHREAHSLLEKCIVRPIWYTSNMLNSIATTRNIINSIEHNFKGVATSCGAVDSSDNPSLNGEACDMHDVMILGFDVCDDSANASRAVLRNLKFECNVGEFLHANGGGMKLDNVDVHNYIEGGLNDANGDDIGKTEWLVTNTVNRWL